MRQVEGEPNVFVIEQSCRHMMGTVYDLAVKNLYADTTRDDRARFTELTEHHRTETWVSCSFKIEWGEKRDHSTILYYDYLAIAPGETLVRIGGQEFTEPYPYGW